MLGLRREISHQEGRAETEIVTVILVERTTDVSLHM